MQRINTCIFRVRASERGKDTDTTLRQETRQQTNGANKEIQRCTEISFFAEGNLSGEALCHLQLAALALS